MSLYRYRGINQYTINAFINDEIYGILPISFNNPYDCHLHMIRRNLRNTYMKIISR